MKDHLQQYNDTQSKLQHTQHHIHVISESLTRNSDRLKYSEIHNRIQRIRRLQKLESRLKIELSEF